MTSHPRSAVALLAACHPGPTAVVAVLALALALGVGAPGGRAALAASAVLAGQLSVGWSNDWIDAGRDVASARADKPTVTGQVTVVALRRAALLALAGCVLLSLTAGWLVPGLLHLAAVASAWAYNLGLKSTPLSWLPYAVSFGLLPLFVLPGAVPGFSVPTWVVLATALLGIGAHLANTLPDLEQDSRTGVRGFPHRIGRRATSILAPLVLAAATAVIVLGSGPPGPPGPLGWTGAVLAAGLAAGAGLVGAVRPRSRLPFSLSMAVAVVCVLQLVLLTPEGVVGG